MGGLLVGKFIAQRKDFELILTVKMETRHSVGSPIGRESFQHL